MNKELVKQLMTNVEFCEGDNLRHKVALFIDDTPCVANFKDYKYYELEDALVSFVGDLIDQIRGGETYDIPKGMKSIHINIPEGHHETVECCPNCGREIDIIIPDGTEKLEYCPFCGQKHVHLCSDCIDEIGDCDPSASCAYCHGKPNGNK